MDEKQKTEDLDDFISKVDTIGSIVKELCTDNDERRQAAIRKADQYLQKVSAEDDDGNTKTGFDKSQINSCQKNEMSPDEFMKYIEKDAQERAEKRKRNKKKAEELKQKGNKLYKEGKHKEAKDWYTEAINLIPDNAVYYSNRALACLQLKEYDQVIRDSDLGIKIDSKLVKCYFHKAKALTQIGNYLEAISTLESITKIDKKQAKLVNEYLKEVKLLMEKHKKEQEAMESIQVGDLDSSQMKILVDFLTSQACCDEQKTFDSISNLSKHIKSEKHRNLFRILKGFDLMERNSHLKRIATLENYIQNDFKRIEQLVSLFLAVSLNSEINSALLCDCDGLLRAFVECLQVGNSLSTQYGAIQLFYQLSQFPQSRSKMKNSNAIEFLIDRILGLLYVGGDVAFLAMGTLNNLVLDEGFVGRFKEKLSENFMSGLVKMMEILSTPYNAEIMLKKFLPVISSSISTVANLFRSAEMRKIKLEPNIWLVSHNLIFSYSQDLDDDSKRGVVYSALGMLMNLSADAVTLGKDLIGKWSKLTTILLDLKIPEITERTTGVLNHVLGSNKAMIHTVIKEQIDKRLIEILQLDTYTGCTKYICKCLALCASENDVTSKHAMESNALPGCIELIRTSKEEVIIGNLALFISYCAKIPSIIATLVNHELVKILLEKATDDKFSKQVRHNCALAIGKFALADQRYLQQLRDLHGLAILHEVMKENKIV